MNSVERPTAYLGILYDRLARKYSNPLEMIQESAEYARQEGLISNSLYKTIQCMVRLPVEDRLNPKDLDNFKKVRILQSERIAYIRLTRVLKKELSRQKHHEFRDISIDWRRDSRWD